MREDAAIAMSASSYDSPDLLLSGFIPILAHQVMRSPQLDVANRSR